MLDLMRTRRGNILFLILLAVVLFAALSYAVTSSMRGGGKSAGPEKARALASAMIQYGVLVQSTVQRTMLVNDVKEYGLDFFDDDGPNNATANATCTNTNCRIFSYSTREGLMAWQNFKPEDYMDPRFTATSAYNGTGLRFYLQAVKVVNVGTDADDLVMRIVGLKPEICDAINQILWGSSNDVTENWGSAAAYQGTLTSFPSGSGVLGDEAPFYQGKQAGCAVRTGIGSPYGGDFYQVLIER